MKNLIEHIFNEKKLNSNLKEYEYLISTDCVCLSAQFPEEKDGC